MHAHIWTGFLCPQETPVLKANVFFPLKNYLNFLAHDSTDRGGHVEAFALKTD